VSARHPRVRESGVTHLESSAAVLTDYHVHLRPDEPDTPAERHFTPANAERYRTVAEEQGIAELGVAEHFYRFSAALEVWDHPFWREWARDDLDAYCGFVRDETDLRLGIEMDFVPGREDRIANVLEERDWDYVVGSIHFLRDLSIDTHEHSIWGAGESADRVWRRYFETLAESARSGLYDIIGHPDLVKVWGERVPTPDGDLRRYYEPAVEAFADAGVAVEVSTAGLRKPVREIYPSRAYLGMLVDAGCPIALSSDAHTPEQLGFRYEQALELLDEVGIRELAVFERRARRLEPIG
jgi:histidinol-phosphatase (PHP family)